MQIRPYDKDDGQRVWLSRSEADQLIDVYRDERPKRRLAFDLALHGLRSEEITQVTTDSFRELDVGEVERYNLVLEDTKRGNRECPVDGDLRQRTTLIANTAGVNKGDPLIDVTTKSLREWIREAREHLSSSTGVDEWRHVGMHDLRRTWATDTYYSLAFAGIPIAEQLTMSWGGWKMTESGRSTFRQDYLGPIPDHITYRAVEHLHI